MEEVQIVNPEGLKEKLSKFKADNFHLVADFDSTLTNAFVDGKKMVSSYAFVREGGYLSPEYIKRAFEYTNYYRPIEFDPKVPQKKKEAKMVEWWSKHYELMIEFGMNMGAIKDIIKKNRMQFRRGSTEFFDLLNKNKVPMLIFSAGLGNLIQEFLKAKGKLTKNVHLVSNFLVFDEEGKAVSYVRPLIHTFNKKEVQIEKFPYHKEISNRKNVILLGDVIGDSDMVEGVHHDNVIKIGFLNENVEELIDDYKKHFDVIILNDGPMDYVNEMLREILG